MNRTPFLCMLVAVALAALACSGGGSSSPVAPSQPDLTGSQAQTAATSTTKAIWGVWEIDIDTTIWQATAIPLRGTQYTVDVVTFLQKPAGNPANLSLAITDISQWFTDGLISVDVGLKHPFPGLDEYTGFDVYGVFVAPGTLNGQYDSNVAYTNGFDEPILLNADGYTRWMNPVEFPSNGTIFRFVPGKLGTPDVGLFTSTINGYKYFADGLDKAQDIAEFFADPARAAKRGMFRPGSFNERAYNLKFPMVGGSPNLVFQYAVIANWQVPDKTLSGDPDTLDVPGDFPLNSNANEAIYLKAANNNSTIFYKDGLGGGDIKLALEVFDWGVLQEGVTVPDEVNQIIVEGNSAIIPGGFVTFDQSTLAASASPGTTSISSVFQVEINDCTPSTNDPVQLLVTVENKYPDMFDPGTGVPGNDDQLAGYFFTSVPVTGEIPPTLTVLDPNGGETLWMALYHNITWYPGFGDIANVKLEWSTDNFVSDVETIVDNTPNDGSFMWQPIPTVATTTAKIRVSDVLGSASDKSDNNFTIAVPVWLDFKTEFDMTSPAITWGGTAYDISWDDFSPCLDQDLDGLVHICWHREHLVPPGRAAYDCGIRSPNGDAWTGEGGFLQTSGGDMNGTPLRTDNAKIAAAANNTSFMAIKHWWVFFSMDVDAWPNGDNQYNYPCLTNQIVLNEEIMADSTSVYLVSDAYSGIGDGPGIYSQKCPTPNWMWIAGPMTVLSNYGEISHSRSWTSLDNKLMLIYYTLNGQIRLTNQTDPVAEVWDDTEVVFDGTGYTGCTDPSICVDGDGRVFAIWTGKENSSGEYHILASMKEPMGTWTTPLIAATSGSAFDELHVTTSADKILLPTGDSEYMVLIGYQDGQTAQSRISPMDLWAFLPAQQVSAVTDIANDLDTLCLKAPYKYDALFSWNYEITPGGVGAGNRDIKFRSADFKTP